MFKSSLFFAFLALSCFSSLAQTPGWQWGKRGGTPVNMVGYGPEEDVNDITTDKWGNVYMLTTVANMDLNINGLSYPSYGWATAEQTCIVSFACDGTMRWYKMVIGGTGDEGWAIKTDTFGGVYVSGYIIVTPYGGSGGPDSGYIRTASVIDTTLINTHYKSWYILKLDTGGEFKWWTMPEPDTLSISSQTSGAIDMDVDDSGNIYCLCELEPGGYSHGAFSARDTAGYDLWYGASAYILKYNSHGNFQSGFELPFRFVGSGGPYIYMKRDYQRHRFYITGNTGDDSGDSLYIHGANVYAMFLACFDDNGNMLWLKHDLASIGYAGSPADNPAIDNDGNIYLTGGCAGGFNFNGTVFAGDVFVVKVDTNGNNVWGTTCTNDDVAQGTGIALSGDKVAVWGYQSSDFLHCGSYSLGASYYRPFLLQLDAATGAPTRLDSLDHDSGTMAVPGEGGGFINGTTGTLTADPYGNFYGGGNFSSELFVAADTLITAGGETDWFIAKFGSTDCNVAISLNNPPNPVAYIHTITVFPNPTNDELTIENANPGVTIKLFNMMGQQVYNGMINEARQTINTQNLVTGIYILQLTDVDGSRMNKTIVKQ